MGVKPKIIELLKWLNEGVYEKEEISAMVLLTAIAGESIFLLGAPGVAKSLVARRLKYAFKEGTAFEYLMNRFSTPDEIFGPVSISQLKDHDKYERIVKNYLPSATVVFLDEIWKASPSIQNSLLTILNEKVYRNGEQEINVPIKALIAASNELPMNDQGLEALWDRFLVRMVVDGIKDRNRFNDMISNSNQVDVDKVSPELKITNEEYVIWATEIDKIAIPENVFDIIHMIRGTIQIHNDTEENKTNQIYISDRRWKKIVRLLRASAFLNDRKAVDLMDCFLIANCIWNETGQREHVFHYVKEAIEKHGHTLEINLIELKDQLDDFENDVKQEISFVKPVLTDRLRVFNKDYYYLPDFNGYFIRIKDYASLKEKELTTIEFLIYKMGNYLSGTFRNCRKGDRNIILVNTSSSYQTESFTEYSIETENKQESVVLTKKPHTATKRYWDKEVAKYLTITSNLLNQIDNYRNTDIGEMRKNLFVKPEFGKIGINNLDDTQSEIEKLEIKIREIQHIYEHIEDQTELDPKLISNA